MQRLTLAILLSLAASTARAAVTCPDGYTPAPVMVPGSAGAKCQKVIAKEASKFAVKRMQTLAKCLQRQEPGRCPETSAVGKLVKAAAQATKKIGKACATGQSALATSWAAYDDPQTLASCTLSQHVATTEILLGIANGTPGRIVASKQRDKCAKEISKQAGSYVQKALGIMNKCFATQMKKATPGTDAAPVCVGSWTGGGAQVPPSDTKTMRALAKLEAKVEKAIAKKCNLTDTVASIESLFACPGAETAADLQACVVCEGRRGAATLFAQENGEAFSDLIDGSAAIQTHVDAATAGAKLLVLPGTYRESVTIASDGLALVGCGAEMDDRPVIRPPDGPGASANGIFAANVDGLLFQSLELAGWQENGIFVTGADGVTFRDVVGDGENQSVYAIYPVQSRNVVVEGCVARRIADAGIYVGQDDGIVVRYNRAEDNVAGIEIENSQFAKVYGNFMQHNTGGLLVFKLPGPPLQFSNDHEIFDNVSIDNNTPNFGDPSSAVGAIPDGTGILVLSNDTGDFHHNIAQGNGTFGLAVIDQRVVNLLTPDSFNPESPDQSTAGNVFRRNMLTGNGTNPDVEGPNGIPAELAGNAFYLLGEPADNCFVDNVGDSGPIDVTGSVCN